MSVQVGPLATLAEEVREVNEANGWYEGDRTFGDDMALLHSEVSEAFEEFRSGYQPNERRYSIAPTLGNEVYDALAPYFETVEAGVRADVLRADHPELFKPEGIPSELADVLIRLLDTASRYGIDLDAAVAEKLAFNRTRGNRHGGKVV